MIRNNIHICHSLELGGISTFVKSLVDLNDKSKINHHILVWQKSYNETSFVNDISNSSNKKKAFANVIKDYELIYVHSLKPFMIPSLLKRKRNVYLFQHGLTVGSGKRKLIKRIFYYSVINLLRFNVVCSSEFAYNKLLKNIGGINRSLVHIIPFGVNLEHKSTISDTSNELKLGFAGRLVKQKRIHKIFEALIGVLSKDKIIFKIAGTGPLLNNFTETARRQTSNSLEVVFEGHLENMADFYSTIDVLILPSIGESYGLVVLEAFYHNIPVIVFSDSGACVDFIKPAYNGYVVSTIKELSECLTRLTSAELRIQLKNNLKNMDLEQYKINNTKHKLDEL